jgi:hypothetical protein
MHGGRPDVVPTVESIAEFAHPDDRAIVMNALQRLADGKPISSHYRVNHPAGQARWVMMAMDPRTEASGSGEESLAVVVDVTDAVQSGITSAVAEMSQARAAIEQAKGVLMVAHGVTADHAFGALRRCSQDTNVKVRDLARRFLATVSEGRTAITGAQVDGGLLTAGLELAAANDRTGFPHPAP